MAGTVLSVALLVPLAIPGYMLGSWRWLKRTRSMWETTFVLIPFFFAWYVVLRLTGGSLALVPIAMLVMAVGFGLGRRAYLHQPRQRDN